jgi:hypothetical protein
MGVITLADVQRKTGYPRHVIAHAIDRYGPEPSGRIGITRVWNADDWPRILASIERTRGRVGRQRQGALQ